VHILAFLLAFPLFVQVVEVFAVVAEWVDFGLAWSQL